MTPRSRNHLTAWLGLVAMWLVVFAPIMSQMLATTAARDPAAALCSALHPTGSNTPAPFATNLIAHATEPVHLSHDDAFGTCGYCHLLEHHIAMPTIGALAAPFALASTDSAPPTLSTRFTPLGAFPSGRPRAPPVVS